MKALILAAGLGTRLRPYTDRLPKPLFPLGGRPLLDITIHRLASAGFREIVVNTHHLNTAIESHVRGRDYGIPVHLVHEPAILGAGGAIKNTAEFWTDGPFLVINGDIATDIDPARVYAFHLGHGDPATLVLMDDPEFNTVSVDHRGFITGFGPRDAEARKAAHERLTFTGIQVLNPEILDFIPNNGFYNS
ncbi:MAG: nucleotidyltransferase family protein, partial [Desulfobacterales bacterium]|nr:nucleotidyltransferase family protein [Desulfobacterales bacterium]